MPPEPFQGERPPSRGKLNTLPIEPFRSITRAQVQEYGYHDLAAKVGSDVSNIQRLYDEVGDYERKTIGFDLADRILCAINSHPTLHPELAEQYNDANIQTDPPAPPALPRAVALEEDKCRQGHDMSDPDNVYRNNNKRQCRTCRRENNRARKKAARGKK